MQRVPTVVGEDSLLNQNEQGDQSDDASVMEMDMSDMIQEVISMQAGDADFDASMTALIMGEFEGEGALRVPSSPARWTVLLGSALALVNYLVMAYVDVFRPDLQGSEENPDAPHDCPRAPRKSGSREQAPSHPLTMAGVIDPHEDAGFLPGAAEDTPLSPYRERSA